MRLSFTSGAFLFIIRKLIPPSQKKVVKNMLEFEEYKTRLNGYKPTLEVLREALGLDAAQKEIEELEAASEREGFWNDVANSQKVQKR